MTPVQNAGAPCTRAPSQQEATRLVFTAWADGRLTAAEADGRNRGRHCQLDQNRDGSLSEAEFVAVSLADFDRVDRNDDGVLSGQREIGAFASPGAPTEAGLTRAQASDIARLRFAVLDRQPRDSAVTLEEYLAVTAQEFARNDTNRDGALGVCQSSCRLHSISCCAIGGPGHRGRAASFPWERVGAPMASAPGVWALGVEPDRTDGPPVTRAA